MAYWGPIYFLSCSYFFMEKAISFPTFLKQALSDSVSERLASLDLASTIRFFEHVFPRDVTFSRFPNEHHNLPKKRDIIYPPKED